MVGLIEISSFLVIFMRKY